MPKKHRVHRSNRSAQSQSQRSAIAVLTEGRVTEPQYVKILKNIYKDVNISIIVRHAGSSPASLIKWAIAYQKNSDKRNPDYDEIWCLFDRNEHHNIEQSLQEADRNNIRTAITNPCFELWLVLHYEDQTRAVSKEDIQKKAQAVGITKGKHLSETGKQRLSENYDDAKTRAQTLEKRHIGNGSKSWENPSSQVWMLVERLALLSEVGDG